jgi:ribA/ribD-fused uncharacterized protein
MAHLRVEFQDLWEGLPTAVRVITTNQQTKPSSQGRLAVMGRGVAEAAARHYPDLALRYGERVAAGHYYHYFAVERLLMVPTKVHWRDPSHLELIQTGLERLQRWAAHHPEVPEIRLPPLGCGNGGRNWRVEVRPLCEQLLQDPRFVLCLTEEQEPPIHYNSDLAPFEWLSNFYPAPLVDGAGRTWPTSEHFYQAQKTTSTLEQERLRLAPTPHKVKSLSRRVTLRPDWEEYRQVAMGLTLTLKYSQHPELRDRLLSTYPARLVHFAPWDGYWGTGRDNTGLNTEGRLHEEIRRTFLHLARR